ncbi:hypothetical protein Pmar_PMAR018151 [Perkinsus marinus ATCC 50983]|uniref:Uncharacterized protein n=1 Tax=Perkinsus marinus (strain ATCC 50983 / TXsc) TaxID=423536 RepID=C5KFW6_PERM5|nr:hypothetical protein Pmar_PMAR018151 [Perkinsus marinus ATCC 50983]EER16614.1 hypothetical protein Pmar_PMAR018151 [Perkinsus marinus ATCC 50983]|eukprot:XP_002784818.1 hypothetical protein Pmar_PMAR018151 [Perkinsus marinus ATCC 50983]
MSEIDKLPPTPPDEEVGKLMRIFVKTTEGLRRCRSEIEIDRGTKRSKGADNALAYAQQVTLKALARDGVSCCLRKGNVRMIDDGYSTWATESPSDDVNLDTQAYWESMRTTGTSSSSLSQETPGEISWEDVDASLRSTFRGVDLAELHRGEPAGEDDIHTNNVLWHSTDDTPDDGVGHRIDEFIADGEDLESLSNRFTDTTAKYGLWKDAEVEQCPLEMRNQQSPEGSSNESENRATKVFFQWCSRERCAPPRVRCLRGGVKPYCYVEVWGISREFRGDKQLPAENFIDPPKTEIGTLEGVREKVL